MFSASTASKNKFGNTENLYISLTRILNGSKLTPQFIQMKKLFYALYVVAFTLFGGPIALHAQTAAIAATSPTPGTITGNLLTVGKLYTGSYQDTFSNAATNYLTIVKGSNGTFSAGPTYGYGVFQIGVVATKISGAPQGNVRLECSPDGSHWYPAAYYNNVKDTALIDSGATWHKTWTLTKAMPYYRAKIITTGTQSSSWVSQYFLQREQIISTTK